MLAQSTVLQAEINNGPADESIAPVTLCHDTAARTQWPYGDVNGCAVAANGAGGRTVCVATAQSRVVAISARTCNEAQWKDLWPLPCVLERALSLIRCSLAACGDTFEDSRSRSCMRRKPRRRRNGLFPLGPLEIPRPFSS